ncbi:Rubrerythrin [Desulfotomaculum arcticum]|uniref:Rubrerythrin n=1 Tax=Desulfotruncus arcticus DSM 17038 TaxID=1121424 RepID=A0A1I2U124_9FIRM|nr:ferritin family protein [Desulfotruncus arcticus]SFG70832.1 Rubrerythrin [Desulfotomaculum arcticum] [Desulfotruncus arcticus DSM 17038]
MSNQVTMPEVYKIALNNELRGAGFYSSMARRSKNSATADIFHKLSEEEKEHHRLFQMLLDKTGDTSKDSILGSETAAFLKSLFKTSVFPADAEELTDRITPEEALSIGIQAEKDSILLYHELFTQTENNEIQAMLSKLLLEEKMHLVELREQLEEMQRPKLN